MAEKRFSLRKERFLRALLAAPSVRQAAKEAKLSERQARRIVADSSFQQRWNELRQESSELAVAMAQREALDSVKTLVELRDDKKAPASARLQAAHLLLEMGGEAHRIERQMEHDRQQLETLRRINSELDAEENDQPALPAHWRHDDDNDQ